MNDQFSLQIIENVKAVIDKNCPDEEIKKTALDNDKVKKYLEDQEVKKIIYVPGKIINIVI